MIRPHSPEVVRQNFRIDLFGAICAGLYIAVIGAFMPVVVRRMGGTSFDVALVVAAPFIGHLLSPIGIYALSGLNPVRVVAGVATASRLVFLAGVVVATTPLMLAMTTVAFWVVTIANIAAYTTVMAAIYPDSERAQAMGKVRVGAALAGVAAAAIAGLLIDALPAQLVFGAVAVLSLPGNVAFFRIRDEGRAEVRPRRAIWRVAREVAHDRRYVGVLAAQTVYGLGNLMTATIIPLLLVDRFDAPNVFVGGLAALSSLVGVAAYVIWGRVIDRGSSLMLSARTSALLLLVPLTYLLAPSLWFLVPLAVVQGLVNAAFDITFHTNIVQIAPRGKVLDYATAQSFLLGVRGTVAPFLAWALFRLSNADMTLVVVLVLMGAGTWLYFRAVRPFESVPEPVREVVPVA